MKSPCVLFLDILNSTSAFNRANSKASGIGEATDGSGLPFERALDLLVGLTGLVQVEDLDPAIGSSDNKKLVAGIHGVDTLFALYRSGRGLLAEIPVLDGLIP